MANRLVEQKIVDSNKRLLVKYVFVSDGTAAANATLFRANTLNFAINATGQLSSTNPQPHYGMSIKRAWGSCHSNGSFILKWWSEANTEILTFSDGRFDYNFDGEVGTGAIPSPDANTVGLCFTASGVASGENFTLILDMKKDNRYFDAGQTADPMAFNTGVRGLT